MNRVVDIILPLYNGEEFLAEALNSILNQTYSNIRLMIINDGSTDSSLSIVNNYMKNDSRISIIHSVNRKTPAAINLGILNTDGDYMTWTSCDNILDEQCIEKLVDKLEEDPDLGFVYAGFRRIGTKAKGFEGEFKSPADILFRFPGMACFMWRRKVIDKIGLFDEELWGIADWDYLWRTITSTKYSNIQEYLYSFRIHDNMTSFKVDFEVLEKKFAQKLLGDNSYLKVESIYPDLVRNNMYDEAYYKLYNDIKTCYKKVFRDFFGDEDSLKHYLESSIQHNPNYDPSIKELNLIKNKIRGC